MLVAACALALMSAGGLAAAQDAYPDATGAPPGKDAKGPEATAVKHVNDAVAVAQKMLEEPRMKELLQQAKGVFIVPTYGRAALGVGASGGAGVLLIKRADGTVERSGVLQHRRHQRRRPGRRRGRRDRAGAQQ